MGGKRRRNTAKTGDKALYKARNKPSSATNIDNRKTQKQSYGQDDDEDMYHDNVDRFHRDKEKEFLKFDRVDPSDSEEDDQEEAVMDLGIGGSSSEESSSSDDDGDDDDDRQLPKPREADHEDSSDDSVADDDDDDDDDEPEEEPEDVRDWGKRKAFYYHGDTADLEIGQDQEDAFLEEEAAKEIQLARLQDMAEEDFAIDDDVPLPKSKEEKVSIERNVKKLSRKEKQKLLDKQHPEFLPLLSHFTPVVEELKDRTLVVTAALLEGEEGAAEAVGASNQGQHYLVTKALIQTATALNLASYLLLKSEQPEGMASHPVMARLQKLHKFAQQLESSVEDQVPELNEQLDNLVKASALMNSGQVTSDDEAESSEGDSKDADAEEATSDEDEAKESHDAAVIDVDEASASSDSTSNSKSGSSSSSSDPGLADDRRRHQVLNEVRFGLRPKELLEEGTSASRKRRAAPDFVEDAPDTHGDVNTKALASTLNSIQQRTTKQHKKSQMAEDLDDFLDQNDRYGEHDMAEEDLTGRKVGDADDEDAGDPELEDENEGDFYSQVAQKSKSRKAARKAHYQVAPKFPRIENEVEGERAVGAKILKNRGLVAHKSRLNRNPRVKKREQYRKALIRRKGAVREVRKDEGHKYGGEETGIKSGLSRSRKL